MTLLLELRLALEEARSWKKLWTSLLAKVKQVEYELCDVEVEMAELEELMRMELLVLLHVLGGDLPRPLGGIAR